MDIEKAYSTHEINRGKILNLFLARNRHVLGSYTTRFCDAYYLIHLVFFNFSQNSLSSSAVHKIDTVLA
jgi:hypothetical protein